MTKSMTGSFYLTETVQLTAGTASGGRVQGSIDLGAYVNVPTSQSLAIESVDFVYQVSSDYGSGSASQFVQGNAGLSVQLTDLNPGTTFVRADNQSLIASGCMNIDFDNNVATNISDLFPDNHGPTALSEAFLVVNDQLYLVAGPDGADTNATTAVYITARIKCRVVKLSTKDWMAIAIQSVAADN